MGSGIYEIGPRVFRACSAEQYCAHYVRLSRNKSPILLKIILENHRQIYIYIYIYITAHVTLRVCTAGIYSLLVCGRCQLNAEYHE